MAAAASRANALPDAVLADLRTDHAGEEGAAQIYRGILAVARDGELRAFAAHHLATELLHLRRIRQWMPASARSRLLPLWRAAGWLTGAMPALLGPRAVFVTVAAVEHFVDRHYAVQVERLSAYPELGDCAKRWLPVAATRSHIATMPWDACTMAPARSPEPGRPSLARARSWRLPPAAAFDGPSLTEPLP